MGRETLENKYVTGIDNALAISRYAHPYVASNGNSAVGYLGDKMVHLRGRFTITAGALGEDANESQNNKFSFADFSAEPPNGGQNAVDVFIRPAGGDWKELMAAIDFTCEFDEGLYGETVSSEESTDTGSYIIINDSVPADTDIHIKIY